MKKLLLSLLIGFTAITCFAQEHLTFKGIPIDGSLSKFAGELRLKGFKYSGETQGYPFFKGSFAGMKDCLVIVLYDDNGVYEVLASSNGYSSWDVVKAQYNKLKEALGDKYYVINCIEEFEDPYSEGDGMEYWALKENKCHWGTNYMNFVGTISMNIGVIASNNFFINIMYSDIENSNKAKASIDKEIESDL